MPPKDNPVSSMENIHSRTLPTRRDSAVSGPSASAPISSCMVARQKIEPKV